MRFLLCCTLLMWNWAARAQSLSPQLLSSSGAHYQNASAQLSFSLGELAIHTLQQGNSVLTQGFHQPAGLLILLPERGLPQLLVYPNPFQELVQIELSEAEALEISLLDTRGRRVYQKKYPSRDALQLHLSRLAPGAYHLRLKGLRLGEQSFQLIKK